MAKNLQTDARADVFGNLHSFSFQMANWTYRSLRRYSGENIIYIGRVVKYYELGRALPLPPPYPPPFNACYAR